MSKPFYCDQLEKFLNHAVARFTHAPDPNDRTKVEVKRVQFTLDTATHPVPGRHYEFVKDPDTGAESMIEWVPTQNSTPAPTGPPVPAAAPQPASAPSPDEGANAATAGAVGESIGAANIGQPNWVIDVGGQAPPVIASAAPTEEGAQAAPAEAQTVQ